MAALHVRLPDSLKERVRALADKEGISVNQFVLTSVAEKVALLEMGAPQHSYLEMRARRAREQAAAKGLTPRERFLQLLEKANDEEPAEEDRLPKSWKENA